jgi:hypothetical protein
MAFRASPMPGSPQSYPQAAETSVAAAARLVQPWRLAP